MRLRAATLVTTLVAILALGPAACGDKHERDHGAEEAHGHGQSGQGQAKHDPETHGDKGQGKAEDGLVRIDPDMLRDLRITIAPAEARPSGETVSALGELTVNDDAYAEIGSPVPARVVKILAGPGDLVKAGQALAELDSPELGKARAEVTSARARMELAEKALARKRTLAADRVVSPRELDEAEAEAADAAAALRAARAALGNFGDGGSRARDVGSRILLTTPVAGTVLSRDAVRGQLTDPARPLFRVGDLSRLWLTVHAFERDAVRLSPGVQARVTFPALPGKGFTGRVTMIGREVDTTSRTIPVRLEVDNADGLLRPGMSATASIPLGDDKGTVVTVPVAALQRVEGEWCVFLPRGEGVFEVRPIGRGRDLDDGVEVVRGLKPGDRLVVEGAFLLKAEVDKSHGQGGHEH